MPEPNNPHTEHEDPRHRMAQRYLQKARDELAAKEENKPRSQRRQTKGGPIAAQLIPSISLSTFLHAILLSLTVTFASFAALWCYVLLSTAFIAGRIVALPTGAIFFASASYASACFLGIIESTSHGHTSPDSALEGGWQDWFWTLPSTLGLASIAAVLGYTISFVLPLKTILVIAIAIWFAYPIFLLSTLENASPLALLSGPILSTLLKRPVAWIVFYTYSFLVFATFYGIGKFVWRDPPYLTVAVMGPVSTVLMFIYAWLLGQLAHWLTIREQSTAE